MPLPSSSLSAAAATALTAERLSRRFGAEDSAVNALRDVSLTVSSGSFTAVMGPSGSGKSTLLHCLSGLDSPTDGKVFLGDVEITKLNDRDLTQLRRERIGFVFQAFNLLP
jgi:putative ABC transport system ATP-binding protein